MAEPANLTVEILKEIRDAIHQTREQLGAEIRQTNARLDQTREELSGRLNQTNSRLDKLEETMLELATQQRFMVREFRTFAERDRRLQSDVDDLKRRMNSVETRLGPGD